MIKRRQGELFISTTVVCPLSRGYYCISKTAASYNTTTSSSLGRLCSLPSCITIGRRQYSEVLHHQPPPLLGGNGGIPVDLNGTPGMEYAEEEEDDGPLLANDELPLLLQGAGEEAEEVPTGSNHDTKFTTRYARQTEGMVREKSITLTRNLQQQQQEEGSHMMMGSGGGSGSRGKWRQLPDVFTSESSKSAAAASGSSGGGKDSSSSASVRRVRLQDLTGRITFQEINFRSLDNLYRKSLILIQKDPVPGRGDWRFEQAFNSFDDFRFSFRPEYTYQLVPKRAVTTSAFLVSRALIGAEGSPFQHDHLVDPLLLRLAVKEPERNFLQQWNNNPDPREGGRQFQNCLPTFGPEAQGQLPLVMYDAVLDGPHHTALILSSLSPVWNERTVLNARGWITFVEFFLQKHGTTYGYSGDMVTRFKEMLHSDIGLVSSTPSTTSSPAQQSQAGAVVIPRGSSGYQSTSSLEEASTEGGGGKTNNKKKIPEQRQRGKELFVVCASSSDKEPPQAIYKLAAQHNVLLYGRDDHGKSGLVLGPNQFRHWPIPDYVRQMKLRSG